MPLNSLISTSIRFFIAKIFQDRYVKSQASKTDLDFCWITANNFKLD